jgi:hypothetical protein
VSLWQTLNLLSGAGLGATWLYHSLAARRGITQIADLTQPEFAVAAETKLPRVSIIVPARNEAAMIETAVRSLLAIDYPNYELIVVDDRSEDATGEILDRLKAEHGARLVVVHVRELPPGWLGKTHAMWSAARQATGEWILFSDADVVHAPEALRRAVGYAERERAAHMVLLPTMLMESTGERMMISFFQAMFIFAYRPWKVRDPKARDSMGVGAFNMVRRSAYEISIYALERGGRYAARRKGEAGGAALACGLGRGHGHRPLGGGGERRRGQPDEKFLCPDALQPGVRGDCVGGTAVAASGAVAGHCLCAGMGARRLCSCARLSAGGLHGSGQAHEDRRRLCAAASGSQRGDGVYADAVHGNNAGSRRRSVARHVLSTAGVEEKLLRQKKFRGLVAFLHYYQARPRLLPGVELLEGLDCAASNCGGGAPAATCICWRSLTMSSAPSR